MKPTRRYDRDWPHSGQSAQVAIAQTGTALFCLQTNMGTRRIFQYDGEPRPPKGYGRTWPGAMHDADRRARNDSAGRESASCRPAVLIPICCR